MNSIAAPPNAVTPDYWPVTSVATAAAAFLAALELSREELTSPALVVCAATSGAAIEIGASYGTPTERLDLIGKAAEALGAEVGDVQYLPDDSMVSSRVQVAGDWAECPFIVGTTIATSDLVDVETERAYAETVVHMRPERTAESDAEWLAAERRQEAADDDLRDAAAERDEDRSL